MIEQVTLDLLQVAMDIQQVRHKAAAANIAMANTPGGQRTTVDFADLIQSLAKADQPQQSAIIDQVRQDWAATQSQAITLSSGAEIKLDQENAELLLASGKYKVLVEGLNRKFGLMQVAVSGGKR